MLSRLFKAFRYRDFRLMWFGSCTSSIGTWMQKLAQSWLVLQISSSPFLLGLDSFLGEIPIVLLSLLGGVIADRRDRRHLLIASQVIQMTCAFLLAALFAFGLVQVWHILTLSFVVGVAQAFGGPAYHALIPSLVRNEDLPNAIALNSIQFNLARIIGPMLGGLALTTLGATWCFGLNGLSFVAVITTLLMLTVRFNPQRTHATMLGSIKEGLSFIRGHGSMASLIVIAFCMTLLSIPLIVFLPVFAKDVFQGGPSIFTLLLCLSGAGSVCGALTVAYSEQIGRQGQAALLRLLLLGVLIAGFALSRNIWLSSVFIFLAGAAMMSVFALISSLVQLITPDDMRGRVMSVYNVAFRGGAPIGALIIGKLIPIYSAPAVIAGTGVLLCVVGAYFLFVNRKLATL